jgi:glycosyltransferase involved in cell wall biosynthesis
MGLSKQGKVGVNSPSIRHWHQFDLKNGHIGNGLRVGSTAFELTEFSEIEKESLRSQDIICVPTHWGKRIIEQNDISVPVKVVNHGVDRTVFNEDVLPMYSFQDERNSPTVFVNCGKTELRKSHDIILECFNKAFEPKDNVKLMMTLHSPFLSAEENGKWVDLYKGSKLGSKMVIADHRFKDQHAIASFMKSADCFLALSRGEGFNLDALEALSIGLELIGTAYSGHTEFMTPANSYLVHVDKLEPAYDGIWFNGQYGEWAAIEESQVDQIVNYMRQIHQKKRDGILPHVNTEGVERAKQFTWEKAAQQLIDATTMNLGCQHKRANFIGSWSLIGDYKCDDCGYRIDPQIYHKYFRTF